RDERQRDQDPGRRLGPGAAAEPERDAEPVAPDRAAAPPPARPVAGVALVAEGEDLGMAGGAHATLPSSRASKTPPNRWPPGAGASRYKSAPLSTIASRSTS